jgi:TolB-like protein
MKLLLLGASILLTGCAVPTQYQEYGIQSYTVTDSRPTYERAANSRLIATNYRAAETLLAQGAPSLEHDQPILAATFVNLDDVSQSSRLGRLISEHIASRFTQQGMAIIELKMRGSIFVRRTEGELLLSREVQDISKSHSAQAVIVGTYARSEEYVYVTAKLVRSIDNVVLAAHNYVLPLDSNVGAMLSR